MRSKNFIIMTCLSCVLLFGIGQAYGAFLDGMEVSQAPEPIKAPPAARSVTAPPPGAIVINFDDVAAPCNFASTIRLSSLYAPMGVNFSGPIPLDGGAILDECGFFSVTGHSAPNFLAFNLNSELSDGGIPRGPERIDFDFEVCQIQANFGAGPAHSGSATLDAYDGSDMLVGSDTLPISSSLQTLSVSAPRIKYVIFSFTSNVIVFDDLAFVPCRTSSPIPTLSEWGMIIMSLILAGSAIWMIRRRQVA
ncbi:MAG: IPTL-CTERM sorting domain-containing protein [Desulfobacteraceae bacterium]|nr:MAG: IPTL-CTERM sorting domain-containing protein [Desulfobacteraceae bacterium]